MTTLPDTYDGFKFFEETMGEQPIPLIEMKRRLSPQDFAHFLRSKGDLFYWAPGSIWIVTTLSLAREVLKSPDYSADRSAFFVSRMPNIDLKLIEDFFGVVRKMMVMSDPLDHAARRKIAALGMTDELLERYAPFIEREVSRLIRAAGAQERVDFVQDIAEKLPSRVLAELLAIPASLREKFYDNSYEMTQFFGGASEYRNQDGIRVNDCAAELRDHFHGLIQKRRQNLGTDFLSGMLRAQASFGLSDEDIVSQTIMMLVAGQVTTTDQLANNFFTMFQHAGVVDTLRMNPQLIAHAQEEFTRLDPAVTFTFRSVRKETELGGQVLAAGSTVFVSHHAANRDPAAFSDPDHCRIDRSPNPHLGFGHGAHFCLGARLARLQMDLAFKEILRQYPNLRLDPDRPAVRRHHSLAFSGFETIPVLH